MKTTYNLFVVSDYKGGELLSKINLTEEELTKDILGIISEDAVFADKIGLDSDNVLTQIEIEQEIYEWFKYNISTYREDGIIVQIYKNVDGELTLFKIEKTARALSKIINESWIESLQD